MAQSRMGYRIGLACILLLAATLRCAELNRQSIWFDEAATIHIVTRPTVDEMMTRIRSDERIGRVTAPLLVLHGERDNVVPIRFGERLFALAREPKRMVRYKQGGHEGLDAHGVLLEVRRFLAGTNG